MKFTDEQYAPCPFCKAEYGMGLGRDPAKRIQVVCLCGARGPAASKSNICSGEGVDEIEALDNAARRAWNQSASSIAAQ